MLGFAELKGREHTRNPKKRRRGAKEDSTVDTAKFFREVLHKLELSIL